MIDWTTRRYLAALLALAGFCTFFALGRGDVHTADEGQRATPPANMLRSGDYVIPTLNGRPYLAKPPLLYWAVAGVYAATGTVNEWTSRATTAFTGIVMVLATYLVFRRRAGEAIARWAALMVLAAPYFLERSRWTNLEVPIWLFTFLTLAACWQAWSAPNARARWTHTALGGLALGAATLLKGPVPYLFLMAALLAYLVVEGREPGRAGRLGLYWSVAMMALGLAVWGVESIAGRTLIPFPAALIGLVGGWLALALRFGGPAWRNAFAPTVCVAVAGLLIAAPWALAVLHRLGWEDIKALLDLEVGERTYRATEINSGWPLFYITQLPLILAPFGLLLPLHLSRHAWRNYGSEYRFAAAAAWLGIAVYSLIAGKEREYVMPTLPFLMLATAFHVHRAEERFGIDWTGAWLRAWGVAARVLLGAGCAALVGVAATRAYADATLIAATAIIALAALLIVAWPRPAHWRARTARIAAAAALLATAGLYVRAAHATGMDSIKDLARLCRDLAAAGHTVEATRVFNYFPYYAEIPIKDLVTDEKAIRARLEAPEPYFYLTQENFKPWILGLGVSRPLYVTEIYGSKEELLVGNADPAALLAPAGYPRPTMRSAAPASR